MYLNTDIAIQRHQTLANETHASSVLQTPLYCEELDFYDQKVSMHPPFLNPHRHSTLSLSLSK